LQLTIDLNGLPLIVCDTAGIRETEEEVELIGIERAVEAYVFISLCHVIPEKNNPDSVQDSDISLCVLSLPDLLSPTAQSLRVEALDAMRPLFNKGDQIVLCNKVDLAGADLDVERIRNQILEATGCRACWFVSLTEGTGTGSFVQGLSSFLQERFD
jgi:tRNA modification GTPase